MSADDSDLQEMMTELGLTVGRSLTDAPTRLDAARAPAETRGRTSERLGRYPVTGRLGQGGMGEVLQVHDDHIGRELAAKVILPAPAGSEDPAVHGQRLAKFVQEAQVTGQLEHPNIVPLYELAMADGQIYFTMKRVEGRTLRAVLREAETGGATSESGERLAVAAGPGRWVPLVQIFIKICDAVAFAHSKGVIHRDLKPENVMIGRFGEVQVMDWGLAKVLGREDPAADRLRLNVGAGPIAEQGGEPLRTMDGQVCGTPHYMSPEQARGEVDRLDARSDVYALGVMLYQALAGRPPFDGNDAWQVIRQVMDLEPPAPSALAPDRGIPWELEAIVVKATRSAPERRYAEVKQLKRDLESWIEGRLLEAAEYSLWQVVRKWAGRNKAAVAAASGVGLAFLTAFAGIGYQLRQTRAQERKTARARDAEARERARAEAARDTARREGKRARRGEQAARAAKADFDRLAYVHRLQQLILRANGLWPRRPALIPAYRRWLQQAETLAASLPDHQATVERLRGTPDPAKAILRASLEQLVTRLTALRAPGPFGPTLAGVRSRLQFAQALAARRIVDRPVWNKAIAAISRLPVYGGLRLTPIPGLLPLGPDPRSGLWEFAHLGTGLPPVRDDQGRLRITGETGLVLVLVPRGKFTMGSHPSRGPNRDRWHLPDELPTRTVELEAFLIGKHEMTQGQWLRATGRNPSFYTAGRQYGPERVTLRHPVTNVNWHQCRALLKRLGLQLPSEAQWEYTARAGTHTIWPYGDRVADLQGKANVADETAGRFTPWQINRGIDDGRVVHAPVGSYAPNPWGLHDVTGNVWEWCRDRDPAYADAPRPGDGLRPDGETSERMLRGGSYLNAAQFGRSAKRGRGMPDHLNNGLGLRPALRLPTPRK